MQRIPLISDKPTNVAMASPRILFVDDHAIVRHGVSVLLNGALGNRIRKEEAGNGEEALELLKKNEFDLIILDISMPGMSGLELLAEIKSKHLSDAPVIIYSMHTEEQFAIQAFALGAVGYVAKHAVSKELVHAVEKVLSGGRYVSETLSQLLLDHMTGLTAPQAQPMQNISAQTMSISETIMPPTGGKNETNKDLKVVNKLSSKEIEVLSLFAQGLTPKEIGDKLGRSEKTVSAHKLAAINKLGADDFSEALNIIKNLKKNGLI